MLIYFTILIIKFYYTDKFGFSFFITKIFAFKSCIIMKFCSYIKNFFNSSILYFHPLINSSIIWFYMRWYLTLYNCMVSYTLKRISLFLFNISIFYSSFNVLIKLLSYFTTCYTIYRLFLKCSMSRNAF